MLVLVTLGATLHAAALRPAPGRRDTSSVPVPAPALPTDTVTVRRLCAAVDSAQRAPAPSDADRMSRVGGDTSGYRMPRVTPDLTGYRMWTGAPPPGASSIVILPDGRRATCPPAAPRP